MVASGEAVAIFESFTGVNYQSMGKIAILYNYYPIVIACVCAKIEAAKKIACLGSHGNDRVRFL